MDHKSGPKEPKVVSKHMKITSKKDETFIYLTFTKTVCLLRARERKPKATVAPPPSAASCATGDVKAE